MINPIFKMKKIYTLGIGIIAFTISYSAQAQRYLTEVFTQIDKTSGIVYGSATTWNNLTDTLRLDVYRPANDTITNRPLMILAHGGSFVAGDREDEFINDLCQRFARRGYVTATISYRLGINQNNFLNISEEFIQAAGRGLQDFNAAVRFFKKSFAETNNTYGIDTTKIIVGGYSAGSLAAMHSLYFRDADKATTQVKNLMTLLGGLEGNSGNAGYSSLANACFNIAGGLLDTVLIDGSVNAPLIGFHGTNDQTVPFNRDFIKVGGFNILVIDGSNHVQQQMMRKSIHSQLEVFTGVDHDLPYNVQRRDDIDEKAAQFFYAWLNNTLQTQDWSITEREQPKIYPNPSRDVLNIELSNDEKIEVYDMSGRLIQSSTLQKGKNTIHVSSWKKGFYIIKAGNETNLSIHKILVQ